MAVKIKPGKVCYAPHIVKETLKDGSIVTEEITMDFPQFAASELRNAWIKPPGLTIYIRRGIRQHSRGDFQLANLYADEPGNGAFTRFLDEWEPRYSFYVENIFNERLRFYLERRGYEYTFNELPYCMVK